MREGETGVDHQAAFRSVVVRWYIIVDQSKLLPFLGVGIPRRRGALSQYFAHPHEPQIAEPYLVDSFGDRFRGEGLGQQHHLAVSGRQGGDGQLRIGRRGGSTTPSAALLAPGRHGGGGPNATQLSSILSRQRHRLHQHALQLAHPPPYP